MYQPSQFSLLTPSPSANRIDTEKLAKLQSQARIGGKGTVRRKVKKTSKNSAGEQAKLANALKKINAQPVPAIQEVNMFKEDGQVIHFAVPKVQASIAANTFIIGGGAEEKEITELAPGILNQLGPNALMSLQRMAQAYQEQAAAAGVSVEEFAKAAAASAAAAASNNDDVPELVENVD